MRVSVEWHTGALEDLADLFLSSGSAQRDRLQRSAHEIDQLLRVSPSQKGELVYAGQLSNRLLDNLLDRKNEIPEIVRRMRLGPLEAIFTGHEEDGRAIVWCIQLRESLG